MIVGSLVLILGIVGGLGVMGIINIPGLTPVKMVKNPHAGEPTLDAKTGKRVTDDKGKPVLQAKMITEAAFVVMQKADADKKATKDAADAKLKSDQDAKVAAAKKKATPAPKAVVKKPDDEAGNSKVAKLWNEMDVAKLKAIVADWKEADLVRVLLKMDGEKVTELLSTIDAKKASALSHAVQKEVAKPAEAPVKA